MLFHLFYFTLFSFFTYSSFPVTLFEDDSSCPGVIKYEGQDKRFSAFKDYYTSRYYNINIDRSFAEKIDSTSFVFVTGFLSNFQEVTGSRNFDELIFEVKKFCRSFECEFDYRHSGDYGMNTSSNIKTNAQIVKKMITDIWNKKGMDRSIVLIGHSKGGWDITTALVELIQENILIDLDLIKVITISTPFGGSPLADFLVKGTLSRETFNLILTLSGGKLDSLYDLTTKNRHQFIQTYCKELRMLSDHYVSFATKYQSIINSLKPSAVYSKILVPFKKILDRTNPENDGFVLIGDQKFGHYIEFTEEMDHLGMVMPSAFPPALGKLQVFKSLLMQY